MPRKCFLFFILLLISPVLLAQYKPNPIHSIQALSTPKGTHRVVNLVVAYKIVNFSGKKRRAIAVNNQIPGPILHFKKGDHVTINVYNHLDKGTSVHWHGILVPWQMDGVKGVSQKAIPPGGVFHYRFTLYQSGTYWYHAHLSAQEQEGLYGAFIIDPPHPPPYKYTKDYVVVLSDWSNTPADNVYANLKKEGEYYAPRFPLQPSLIKFTRDYRKASPKERKQLMNSYLTMQKTRMNIYDLSDVAYDAYLLNGKTKTDPWTAPIKVGDIVRLRFIDAGASTIYRVKIPNSKMQLVHVQGNNVKARKINHFIIAPGETNDVLVKIQKNKPYIIYAESIDTLGKAYGVLTTHPHQVVSFKKVQPFPEPPPVTKEMMHNMMLSKKHHNSHHPTMRMHTEPTIVGDTITPINPKLLQIKTVGTGYQNLIAAVKTNNPHKPIAGIIRMELFGYMDHYIWFINGLPEYKAKPIIIRPGKRYRIIFTNNSMMRHPMHIHGHWFILRNGHGSYDPLLHTIDVPPGATAVADVDMDASGQWFFHCHHLYHMLAGMARVFQYTTIIDIAKGTAKPVDIIKQTAYINRPIVRVDEILPLVPSLIDHPIADPSGFYFANFLDIGEDPFSNIQEATFKGLYGSDYNKLELFSNEAEINNGSVDYADIDIFYWHLISQFWAVKGGANYFYRPGGPYWQPGIGIEGMMPYFIETDLRIYFHDGSVKFDLELSRDTQITNNFFIRFAFRSIAATKTIKRNQIGNGLNQIRYFIRPYYRVMPGLSIFTEFEHQQNFGAFEKIRSELGHASSENILTFGLSIIF